MGSSIASQGPSEVLRSDDDGATWTPILTFPHAYDQGVQVAPFIALDAIAYNPAAPDQVYVSTREVVSFEGEYGRGVKASMDGGATWSDLGTVDIGVVRDLALGIDGQNLYAATDTGVWRMSLQTVQAPVAGCTFTFGFKDLHDLAPDIVGDCTSNETHAANGDALQTTTRGLLAWRKADNWTAFTDGVTTWINGPEGLQSRPNDERFPWEA
jgi:hypothetical protein